MFDGATFYLENQLRTFFQPRAENRVLEVSARFLPRGDREFDRDRASSETPDLRKDEPDPVARLHSSAQFLKHALEHRRLGLEKAIQIVRVGGRAV